MAIRVLEGDCRDVLKTLPSESVHTVVTSPPYYGLRDYGTAQWSGGDVECLHLTANPSAEHEANRQRAKDKGYQGHGGWEGRASRSDGSRICKCGATRTDSQLGLEATPAEYIASMVSVFREVRRVLRKDGTCWVNIGDSYAGSGKGSQGQMGINGRKVIVNGDMPTGLPVPPGLKPKDLIGIPWMLAFALREDGWYLRADIIWSKPNPMPESVTDRPTKAHEYVFLLTKSARYFYDADAIRETDNGKASGNGFVRDHRLTYQNPDGTARGNPDEWLPGGGRNKRSVWEIATEAFPEAHFATYPTALVDPCIKAGTSEKGCCPTCGAPVVRVMEGESLKDRSQWPAGWGGRGFDGVKHQGSHTLLTTDRRTTGWRASCAHDLTPVPCKVLDPFMGAGTTLLVADRLNRDGIGIELSSPYATMARARLVGDAPMFVQVS